MTDESKSRAERGGTRRVDADPYTPQGQQVEPQRAGETVEEYNRRLNEAQAQPPATGQE